MSDDFDIGELGPGDAEAARELFGVVYGRDSDRFPSRAEWDWRYCNSLYPSSIWLARAEGRLAAQRPALMKSVAIGGRIYPAAHFMDVMTHPAYRRQGLFARLVRHATEAVTTRGAAMCYTFPNENSLPGYLARTDWTHVGSLALFMRPIRAGGLLAEKIKRPGLRRIAELLLGPVLPLAFHQTAARAPAGIRLAQVTSFGPGFDALWEELAGEYGAILCRDSAHLNWRYTQRPSVAYTSFAALAGERVRGFTVVRTRHMFGLNLGLIVELITQGQDQDLALALLQAGIDCLLADGADAIGCLAFDGSQYGRALRRAGLRRLPARLLPRGFPFLARANRDDPALQAVLQRQNWHLSWGDNDAV